MRSPRRLRTVASLGAVLSLTGVWIGHAVEYARVWGFAGLDTALVGRVHVYMLPLAAVLVAVAALLARRAWQGWQRLAWRLDTAAVALRAALRGRPQRLPARRVAAPSWKSRILSLALAVTLLQVLVYILQENLEALAAGAPLPGIGVITGVHWAAALVQADTAFLLLAAVALLLRAFSRREAVVAAAERLVRSLSARLRPQASAHPVAALALAPYQRLGCDAWSRPPPCAAH